MTAPALLTVAAVVLAAMLGGGLARLLGQPSVVGQMLTGIALGPSLLGWLAPGVAAGLVPPSSRGLTDTLAQLGVACFVLLVGMEVRVARGGTGTVAAVVAGSVALPMALGCAAAVLLPAPPVVPRWAFVLFVGTALSVTAVPVLALVLREHGMARSPIGVTSLAAAGASDAVAWCLLVVVSAAAAGGGPLGRTLLLGAVLLVVAGCLRGGLRVLDRRRPLAGLSAPVLVGAALVAAACGAALSQQAGLHSVVGPLVLGLAVPRSTELVAALEQSLGVVARAVLLPFFFLSAGFRVDLPSLGSPVVTAGLLVAAVVGKVVGAAVPARLTGVGRRSSVRLGILLNTRGLTELVFLAAGLQSGLIGSSLYTSLVVVALLTTVSTGPLLRVTAGPRPAPDREGRFALTTSTS